MTRGWSQSDRLCNGADAINQGTAKDYKTYNDYINELKKVPSQVQDRDLASSHLWISERVCMQL